MRWTVRERNRSATIALSRLMMLHLPNGILTTIVTSALLLMSRGKVIPLAMLFRRVRVVLLKLGRNRHKCVAELGLGGHSLLENQVHFAVDSEKFDDQGHEHHDDADDTEKYNNLLLVCKLF